jgi:hypothetical protein
LTLRMFATLRLMKKYVEIHWLSQLTINDKNLVLVDCHLVWTSWHMEFQIQIHLSIIWRMQSWVCGHIPVPLIWDIGVSFSLPCSRFSLMILFQNFWSSW